MPGMDHFRTKDPVTGENKYFRVKCRFGCLQGSGEPSSFRDPNTLRKHHGRVHNLWSTTRPKSTCSRCDKGFDDLSMYAEHVKKGAENCDKSRHQRRVLPVDGSPEYAQAYADTFAYAGWQISEHLKVPCDANGKRFPRENFEFQLVGPQGSGSGSAGSASQNASAAAPAPWDTAQVAGSAYQQALQPAQQNAGVATHAAIPQWGLLAGTVTQFQQQFPQHPHGGYAQQVQPTAQMMNPVAVGMPQNVHMLGSQNLQGPGMYSCGSDWNGPGLSGHQGEVMWSDGTYPVQQDPQAQPMRYDPAGAADLMGNASFGLSGAGCGDYAARQQAQQPPDGIKRRRSGDCDEEQTSLPWGSAKMPFRSAQVARPQQSRQALQTGYSPPYPEQMTGGAVQTPQMRVSQPYDAYGMVSNFGPVDLGVGNFVNGAQRFGQQTFAFPPSSQGGAARCKQQSSRPTSFDGAGMPRQGGMTSQQDSGAVPRTWRSQGKRPVRQEPYPQPPRPYARDPGYQPAGAFGVQPAAMRMQQQANAQHASSSSRTPAPECRHWGYDVGGDAAAAGPAPSLSRRGSGHPVSPPHFTPPSEIQDLIGGNGDLADVFPEMRPHGQHEGGALAVDAPGMPPPMNTMDYDFLTGGEGNYFWDLKGLALLDPTASQQSQAGNDVSGSAIVQDAPEMPQQHGEWTLVDDDSLPDLADWEDLVD